MATSTIVLVFLNICLTKAFYIPGVAPSEFSQDDVLEIKAVSLTSAKTQLPYEYYDLPFCKPVDKGIHYKSLNLGEVLRGDRIVNTPYNIKMLNPVTCQVLCEAPLNAKQSTMFVDRIKDEYTLHMILDNLPAATVFKNLKTNKIQYEDGFKLGFSFADKHYLNNHLYITILYHEIIRNNIVYNRIVGFEVEPQSIAIDSMITTKKDDITECALSSSEPKVFEIKKDAETTVRFSYSVQFKASDVAWASRWDTYLRMSDVQIHWFSICNSLAIILFLSSILALIFIRTLRRDIARYNMKDDELDEVLEETGWKLVHGDVFRPPNHPTLLVAFLGSGIQLFCMMIVLLVFAMFGMLSPASRGALMTAGIVFFMFMGIIGGYHAARLYRTIKGNDWKKAGIATAMLYPSIVFGTGFLLNFFIWGEHSSGAVPFTTMIALLCLWCGISCPLVLAGFYFGYRKQPYEYPVRTNQIPRQIPEQPWYLSPVLSSLIAGILPFGAIFVELFFILSAIWENQFYYLFGFLYLVFIILVLACAEVTIAMTYFQLCAESYHWWWRSFLISSSPSYYVFAYSIIYYFTKLDIEDFVPTLLYFGYTVVMVIGFWLLTGTIGFYATYFFIRKVYAAVKQD